jgi:hypothetical protein
MTDDTDDTTDARADREFNQGRQDAVSSGTKIRGKVKRGTGTRDQDELVIEGRGADAEEAAADFEAALEQAEANDWADRLRALQPDDG